MTGDLYSQSKCAWHLDRIATLREGRAPVPVQVQLILSDLCQQDCQWCAYRVSTGLSHELFGTAETHNPNRKIPTGKALAILSECAELGVKAVQFTGGGEPTVHPDHLEIFAHAQALGMETALVTNGVRLDPAHPAVRAMKWIRVSIDAGNVDDYTKIRRCPPAHWDRAWGAIAGLGRTGYEGVLGVGFVIALESYRGILAAASRAKESGAANMRVGAVFTSEGSGYYGNALEEIQETVRAAKTAVDGDGFTLIDLFTRRVHDLEAGSPEHPECGVQHFTMYVGGDLNVYRCCNVAYTTAGRVGSLAGVRLQDAVLAYAPFDARTCRHCQFRGQNEVIKALVMQPVRTPEGEPPPHVNFV